MGVGGRLHAPAALPPGKTRYPLYRRLGGSQGRSGRVRKIPPPPPGFGSRTIQPVACRYTDWAIPAHYTYPTLFIFSTHVTLSSSALHIHVFWKKSYALHFGSWVRGKFSEKCLCASSEQKWNVDTWQATPCILEDSMHHTYLHIQYASHLPPYTVCITPTSICIMHHTYLHIQCASHLPPYTVCITPTCIYSMHHTYLHIQYASHLPPYTVCITLTSIYGMHHTYLHIQYASHLPPYTVCITPTSIYSMHQTYLHIQYASHLSPYTVCITPTSIYSMHHTHLHIQYASHLPPYTVCITPTSIYSMHHTYLHENLKSHAVSKGVPEEKDFWYAFYWYRRTDNKIGNVSAM
jgi:hypothetical protein